MMIKVIPISVDQMDSVKKFLKAIPTIKELDDEIIKNTVIALDQGQIVGTIAYEVFGQRAFIRYFVFKKILSDEIISKMFESLKEEAKKKQINYLYSLVNNEIIEKLFIDLEFNEIDRNYFYIDETKYEDTEQSKIMEYIIK